MKEKKFNLQQWKNEYNRKNYKRWDTKIKPDLYEIVENYRTDNKLSRSEFLQKAIELLSKNNKK
jgi:hypothetical protein|nr:MAG TPA: repressor [Caudoviricetes sp.]